MPSLSVSEFNYLNYEKIRPRINYSDCRLSPDFSVQTRRNVDLDYASRLKRHNEKDDWHSEFVDQQEDGSQ